MGKGTGRACVCACVLLFVHVSVSAPVCVCVCVINPVNRPLIASLDIKTQGPLEPAADGRAARGFIDRSEHDTERSIGQKLISGPGINKSRQAQSGGSGGRALCI